MWAYLETLVFYYRNLSKIQIYNRDKLLWADHNFKVHLGTTNTIKAMVQTIVKIVPIIQEIDVLAEHL